MEFKAATDLTLASRSTKRQRSTQDGSFGGRPKYLDLRTY